MFIYDSGNFTDLDHLLLPWDNILVYKRLNKNDHELCDALPQDTCL